DAMTTARAAAKCEGERFDTTGAAEGAGAVWATAVSAPTERRMGNSPPKRKERGEECFICVSSVYEGITVPTHFGIAKGPFRLNPQQKGRAGPSRVSNPYSIPSPALNKVAESPDTGGNPSHPPRQFPLWGFQGPRPYRQGRQMSPEGPLHS